MAKTVIITGGASGMGFLTGKCYAKEGENVVLVDINKEALDKCVAEISEISPNVIGVCIDIRKYDEVCKARDAAVERFGSIDILICYAGGAECRLCGVSGEFQDNPIEIYDFSIDTNLKGALYFDHAVMKQMAKQNSGVIIHIGSITGQEGTPWNIGYSASKSALMNGMTKSIALAGAKYNIRCACVSPGPVMTRPGMSTMKTMLGRAADPQEIVDLVMFVAGEKGAFISGVNFLIDGGRDILRNK